MPRVEEHFAILAPVPGEHLRTGLSVCQVTGFVAFGTNKWDFLVKVDEMRKGKPIPVLIYPSHEDDPAKLGFIVEWFGWYVGFTQAIRGVHPNPAHRPPSAMTDGPWAAFWHAQGLRQLPPEKRLAIGAVPSIKGGWRKNKPPRGPELVAVPELLSYET
jgi:hypothetical protein